MKKQYATVGGVKISSPERIVYPKQNLTKQDVATYYELVGARMLKYGKNRVVSVIRCNQGVGGACFFKKHPVKKARGTEIIELETASGNGEYFYLTSKSGILNEVQAGTIEFHLWGSTVGNLDKPDVMVFDLDPDVGMNLDDVRRGVKDLKGILDGLGLKSFLKTSGGKGYHVVVPFMPSASWEEFRAFAKGIADLMESKYPERYTSNMRKVKRHGKIFIDWVRNTKGATSVAPYSLRARDSAAVSMPISWRELNRVAPDGIDISMAVNRLSKADPWKDFFKIKQSLNTNQK